jgi:hypothetical protein
MAIGRINGPMLFSNLERQGVDLAIDGNLIYADVTNRRVGISTSSPQYTLDVPGNVRIANLTVLGNTITSNSGVIGLGSISNVSITGGNNYDVVYTDGSGTLKFGNLNYLSGLDGFTGNNIALGTNTQGSLSTAVPLTTTTTVTDAIADLNMLLGNITNSSGNVLNTTTLTVLGNASIASNLTVGGNILVATGNVISLNSAFFVGNTVTGFNALYAGIPSGYSVLPQVVAQFSENFDGYAQINTQNINAGGDATTDYVATANNGTDTTFYVDLGIAGSGYDPNSPFNSLGNVLYPNDAYLYTQGNTSADIGGNLVIGTTVHGRNLVIITGGVNTEHTAATFWHAGTASSTTTNGTFVVNGGVGISGNVNAGNVAAASGVFTTLAGTLASTSIVGTVATANVAYYANVSATSTNATYSPVLVNSTTGNLAAYTSSYFTINPGTGTITLSSNSALQLPSGTTANRPAGVAGYVRYNSDNAQVEYYNGMVWVPVTNTVTDQAFSGDGTNATYTLDQVATNQSILVSINGTLQQPGVAYTASGNQITFAEIPLTSDVIDIRFLGGVVSINTTLTDDLTVSGNITLSGILQAPQTTKASNAVGTAGQICWDSNYIYVCTATNTWKRSPLTGGY